MKRPAREFWGTDFLGRRVKFAEGATMPSYVRGPNGTKVLVVYVVTLFLN